MPAVRNGGNSSKSRLAPKPKAKGRVMKGKASSGVSHYWGGNEFFKQEVTYVHQRVDTQPDMPSQNITPILQFALGDISFENCFSSDDAATSLPEALETVESITGGIKTKPKKERNLNSDAPILRWKELYRSTFLDQILALHGRGRFWGLCVVCQTADAAYRCRDCFGYAGMCRSCILKAHERSPLHILEEWKKDRFQKVTLKRLGYRFQLGHQSGRTCLNPTRFRGDFTVLACNGIHQINLDFCGCNERIDPNIQLLEVGWWPATNTEPKTAATIDLLRLFQLLNLNGSIACLEFYRALEDLTDPEGLDRHSEKKSNKHKLDSCKSDEDAIPDRLQQLMDMVRQFRHIMMLKRGGRGHDPAGILATASGSLTEPCRACPYPEINLPDGWQMLPKEESWIYARYLAEDANFKQKARVCKNDARDPSLGPGWATFVDNDKYMAHLKENIDDQEINHCVGFAALWNANKKRSKGLRATGIGSVVCARHQCFLPNGTGDLHCGKKYVYMDFLILSAIVASMLTLIFVSYDIACQWYRNFYARMKRYQPYLHLPSSVVLNFLVPKFHLPVHVKDCWSEFSFNYRRYVGRTDGEGIERIWAWLNRIAFSASMMTAGARWDTLDDFCNYNNFRKVKGLEQELLKRMAKAIPMAITHFRAFRSFSAGLLSEGSVALQEWEKEIRAWDEDMTRPSPYILPDDDITIAQVKKRLTEQEHQKAAQSGADASLMEVTASSLIIAGLEIEELQRNIETQLSKQTPTVLQSTELQSKRTSLLKQIQRFRAHQQTYMPGLIPYLNRIGWKEPADALQKSETMQLFLPSSFTDHQLRESICPQSFSAIEDELRFAQLVESLGDLRRQLRQRMYAGRLKNKNGNGQAYFLRSNTFQTQVEGRIRKHQEEYRAARKALLSLRGAGEWSNIYQDLRPEDVRGISEVAMSREEAAEVETARRLAGMADSVEIGTMVPFKIVDPRLAVGEGKKMLSWIWYTVSQKELHGDNREVELSLKTEWAKTRARALRWKEELVLLEEEMRRSIEFCWYMSKLWTTRRTARSHADTHVQEGIVAYAIEQSCIEQSRATKWSAAWFAIRERGRAVLEKKLGDVEEDLNLSDIEISDVEDDDIDNF